MRQTLLLGLAGAALGAVACSGSDDNIARTGDGDGSAEAGDGGSGGSSRGTGGRPTGTGGRRIGTGGRLGTGGRPSTGGTTGTGGAVASGGAAGSGGTLASGGAGGAVDAGAPDARDASTDATSTDATSQDASSSDSGESGSDAGVIPFAIDLNFDNTGGQITYSGLNANNWSADPQYTLPHSGSEAILSANGNATGTFANIGFSKVLGDSIQNRQYRVSFWVVQYYPGMSGIELSDFSVLRLGGPNGTMTWTDTPVPTVADVWVKWTGIYTAAQADVGLPFRFEAIFDLDGMHSIGIDGPIVAEPL